MTVYIPLLYTYPDTFHHWRADSMVIWISIITCGCFWSKQFWIPFSIPTAYYVWWLYIHLSKWSMNRKSLNILYSPVLIIESIWSYLVLPLKAGFGMPFTIIFFRETYLTFQFQMSHCYWVVLILGVTQMQLMKNPFPFRICSECYE